MNKMRLALAHAVAITVFLLFTGCNKKEAESSGYNQHLDTKPSKGPNDVNHADDWESSNVDPANESETSGTTKSTIEEQMDRYLDDLRMSIASKRYLAGATEADLDEVRSSIQDIATNTGTDIAEVLTSFLKSNPEADGLTTVIARLYPNDPSIVVDAFTKGTHGINRSHALSAYASMLSDQKNVQGLQVMYDSLPASQDRVNTASQHVNAVAVNLGLSQAMTILKNLDLREEKSISIRSLYPYIRQNRHSITAEDLEQFYQLAGEFDNEQSARARTAE